MGNLNINTLTAASVRERHDRLLDNNNSNNEPSTVDHLTNSPLFAVHDLTQGVKINSETTLLQCGLLASIALEHQNASESSPPDQNNTDKRLFFNVTTPSSIFICGSQGSGKSHTLSCLLENCLVDSDATVLPRPLSALLFHYDTFISDDGGSPCEAAFLASLPGVRVRIICAPTNLSTIRVSQVSHLS
jgi:DNA replication protein DnaC